MSQLVVQKPVRQFARKEQNQLENKAFLQLASETKCGVLSAPIVFAILGSKRSKLDDKFEELSNGSQNELHA